MKYAGITASVMLLAAALMAQPPGPVYTTSLFETEPRTESEVIAAYEALLQGRSLSQEAIEAGKLEVARELLRLGQSDQALEVLDELQQSPPSLQHAVIGCRRPRMEVVYPYDGWAKRASELIRLRQEVAWLGTEAGREAAIAALGAGLDVDLQGVYEALDEFSSEEKRAVYTAIEDSSLIETIDGTALFLELAYQLGESGSREDLATVVLWQRFRQLDTMAVDKQQFFLKIFARRPEFESALSRRSKTTTQSGRGGSGIYVYTEDEFGYPIPFPIDSETPLDGFRSHAALTARYENLAAINPTITSHVTGSSIDSRTIRSYTFLRDGSFVTPEGIAKGAAAMQGSIHAREWASPEVVAGIFEWLALEVDSDVMANYLLDHLEIMIHPLGNPDGLLQTQRYPDRVVGSFSPGRDGRNRRKNMRNVDEDLATLDDYLLGVDLNRNHPNGWSGGSATSLLYGGASPQSEPESTALSSAIQLIDTSRLRLYIDFHSDSQDIYVCRDFQTGYDVAARAVANLMDDAIFESNGTVNGPQRDVDFREVTPAGFDDPIGATDEAFALEYGCLAYTSEIRSPRTFSPNGFVLPESEVAAARQEQLAAAKSALYYVAGPATVIQWDVYTLDGTLLYSLANEYDDGNNTRMPQVLTANPLTPGVSYQVVARFNKPMRVLDGVYTVLPGVSNSAVVLTLNNSTTITTFEVLDESTTLAPLRYASDSLRFVVSVPLSFDDEEITLSITATDAAGLLIDQNPATVADWSAAGWTNAEQTVTPQLVLPVMQTTTYQDGFLVR